DTMRASVLLETLNPVVALDECVLCLALSATGNRQLPLELPKALLSLALLDPQPIQFIAHVSKLSLARFHLELERALRLVEPPEPIIPLRQGGFGLGESAARNPELVLERRLAFAGLGAARLLVPLEAAQQVVTVRKLLLCVA